ncbi:MAG: hypothetical protein HC897_09440, partial [Thermoanaerobaculia bacterium]|nr:hypothetical protein [Thermoanaerobaculia bacterium]
MAKTLEYNATLIERTDFMEGLANFRIRPDEPLSPGWFVPGQYVTLGLNRDAAAGEGDLPESVRRPMSIASAPEQADAIDFYIRYVDHPESSLPFTHLLWRIKPGDRIYWRPGAVGHFTIEGTLGAGDSRLKVMLAAGTGLAPFMSIVRSRVLQDPDARMDDLAIVHGASYPAAIGYQEELEGYVERNGLRYVPTVSRPKEAPEWRGATGRAEALFSPERIEDTERRLGLEPGFLHPERAGVLVCGLQGTVTNSLCDLLYRGFVPDNRKIRRALGVADDVKASFSSSSTTTPPSSISRTPRWSPSSGRGSKRRAAERGRASS